MYIDCYLIIQFVKADWDIFCSVIDNFGDIGVCWRLALQLSQEHQIQVRLIVDDLNIASKIIPHLDPQISQQNIAGVEIQHWHTEHALQNAASVVIEAFGCEVPAAYLDLMEAQQSVWINLEYLSAEAWVEGAHLLPSPHPRKQLNKTFFFPGFTSKTGGLIRERDLISKRETFVSDKVAQARFLASIGLQTPSAESYICSLFCYPHAPIHALLDEMMRSEHNIVCLLPATGILTNVASWLGLTEIHAKERFIRGNLTLEVMPFLSQGQYDQLLWCCDINFVRGEDSWIRAIWAAKPFIWQPYPQDSETCGDKLEAFISRYLADEYGLALTDTAKTAFANSHRAWLSGESAHFNHFLSALPELTEHASRFAQKLSNQADLAHQLVAFVKTKQHT